MDLKNENIFILLLKYSIPATVGMMINAIYNLADRIFVSYGVGSYAFSSMTVTGAIFMILQAFGIWIGIGTASIISIKLGEGKKEDAEKFLGNAIIMMIFTNIVVILIVIFFMNNILLLFGASIETLEYGREYLKIIMLGFPFMTFGTSLYHIARASGNPKKAMYSMLISGLIDLVLNYIFIFIFDWGISGAALSTIIAQIISMVYIFSLFLSKNSLLKIKIINLIPKIKYIKKIYITGLSSFFTQVASSFIAATVNNQLLLYANSFAVGAYGAINSTYSIFLMPVFGIGQGCQPIIGYNFGSKLFKRVRKTLYYSLVIAFIFGIIGWLCFHLQSEKLMSLFTNNDKEIMHFAVSGLEKLTLFFPLATVQAVGQVYFQAIGKPKITLVLSILRQFVFLIPSLLILPLFIDLDGVWYAIPLAEFFSLICTSTTLYILIKKMMKKEILIT